MYHGIILNCFKSYIFAKMSLPSFRPETSFSTHHIHRARVHRSRKKAAGSLAE